MRIRPVLQNDFEDLHKLVCQVHSLHVENRPDVYADIDLMIGYDFDSLLCDDNAKAFVAEDNGRCVGVCSITILPPPKSPLLKSRTVAHIENLCVDANYRKQGIGNKLLQEAKIWAKEKGADSLELIVWAFNRDALTFYKNAGMKERSFVMEQKL